MDKPKSKIGVSEKLKLQLYVSGMTPKSMDAIENIRKYCNAYFKGAFSLEIIDLYKRPDLAIERQIVFIPSLIKLLPGPRKIIIGDLSDESRLRKVLGVGSNDLAI